MAECLRSELQLYGITVHCYFAATLQKITYVAADVSTFEGACEAIKKCPFVPDTVFCCAGGAKPGFFAEQTESDFEDAVKTDYFTALSTAHVSF